MTLWVVLSYGRRAKLVKTLQQELVDAQSKALQAAQEIKRLKRRARTEPSAMVTSKGPSQPELPVKDSQNEPAAVEPVVLPAPREASTQSQPVILGATGGPDLLDPRKILRSDAPVNHFEPQAGSMHCCNCENDPIISTKDKEFVCRRTLV